MCYFIDNFQYFSIKSYVVDINTRSVTKRFNHEIMPPKDVDCITNCADFDQAAPLGDLGLHHLPSWERGGLVVISDSGARGLGLDTVLRLVLQTHLLPQKYW